jgi:hypothetical protein
MAEMFQDREGNTSSKRIIGVWTTAIGIAMLITVAVNSILWPGEYESALEAAEVIFGGGMGLLGVSVMEYLGKKHDDYSLYTGGK